MELTRLEEAWFSILPSTFGALICGGLTVLSLLMGRQKRVNYLFAAICFMGAIINADLALINLISDEMAALRIDRFTYIFFVFGPAVYIHFVHTFLGIKKRRRLEITAYGLGLVFLILSFSNNFIEGFYYHKFGRIAKGGIFYHLFTAFCALAVIYSISVLYLFMKGKSNVERNRIKYVICGLGIGSLLLTFNIIPTYGLDIYPFGSLSFIPALVLAAGVLKYDLLDIRAAIRKGFSFTVLTIIIALIYTTVVGLFNLTIALFPKLRGSLIPPLISALVMVVIFDPLKSLTQNFVEKLFYRRKIDYEEVLKEASNKLTSLFTKEEICDFISNWVELTLQVERIGAFIRTDGLFKFMGTHLEDVTLPYTHPLPLLLENTATLIHRYQVPLMKIKERDKEELIEFFDSAAWSVVVPVIYHGGLIAFLAVGEKKSGEVFLKEDLAFLVTLANQTGIALENARAFQELKTWNEKLEQRVQERTAELLRALREKELAQKQMIRSESLAAIGQLVAGTAHELNNPLSSAMSLLQSSIEGIKEMCQDSEISEIVDDLQFARKELQRAADIVRSLLDVSRETETYAEEVNLNAVLEDALRVLHNMIKKMNVTIHTDFSPYLPTIHGNFAQLGQVFINIIKNGLQALPKGKGEIWISTRYDKGKGIITAECADSGTGIPEEIKDDVFKPFYTTKEVGAGTGLGLYICHELIRRHSGTIEILDRTGGGTVMRVSLPIER